MSRILTLDIAKGIGIILVVVGHCINAYTIPGIFIYAFHMPLFFFISGICFNGEKNKRFLPFMYKRFLQLIIPAVLFSAIIISVSFFLLDKDIYLSNISWIGFPHAIWFLGILFIVEITYWGIYKSSKSSTNIIIFILLGFLIGAWTSSQKLCYPYSIFTSFSALAFYALGNLLQPLILKFSKQKKHSILFIIAGVGAILVECIFCIKTGHVISMVTNNFVLTDLFSACFGIFAIICISKSIELFFVLGMQNIFIWLGHNTLGIMCSHILLINISNKLIEPLISNHLLYKLTESLFVWIVVIVLSIFINHNCRWLVGKR